MMVIQRCVAAVILASPLTPMLPARATVAQSSVQGQWSDPYNLFLLNGDAVPSIGRIARIGDT